ATNDRGGPGRVSPKREKRISARRRRRAGLQIQRSAGATRRVELDQRSPRTGKQRRIERLNAAHTDVGVSGLESDPQVTVVDGKDAAAGNHVAFGSSRVHEVLPAAG